ncbi:MAG TPA: glycosyltransferase family 2 protein [Methanocella sp.]
MSTVLHSGEPLPGQEPFGETSPGREFPDRSAVIIYGEPNYLMLGTLAVVARSYVDDVFVAVDKEDARVNSLARSLGIRVIVPGSVRDIDAIFASYGPVVALRGDGSHDPCLIPDLLHGIREGHDASIVEAPATGGPDENALLLNNKRHVLAGSGFVALSRQAARNMRFRKGESLGMQMAGFAKTGGLKARYFGDSKRDHTLFEAYRIGVVVPAYNEELLLGETVRGIPDYVSRIYVIDDCSTDRTPAVIAGLEDPRVVPIRHEVNGGVGASILDGYRMALWDGMDLVAVMAGDNQMDPAELPKLLMPVIEGRADYAKGNRLLNRGMRKGMSPWRQLGNGMLTMLNKIASGYWQVSDPQNGYTVISRRALELLDLGSVYTYYGYCNDLLVKLNTFGLRTVDVPIPARYGNEKSKIRYGRFVRRVSPMLFKSFLRRLKVKYTVLDFHPLVLFYYASMALVPAGLLSGLLAVALLPFAAGVAVPLGLLAAIVEFAGVQSLFTAMALDYGVDRQSRTDRR